LDRESINASVALDYMVTVSDGGSPVVRSSSTSLRLLVVDVDDNRPVFALSRYEFEMPERQPAGFHVGFVVAVDADDPPFNQVVYRLSADANGLFDIDGSSGVIVTAAELDHEQVPVT